ncbi:MAG TPA: hypothetical protein VHY20_15195 [Pirellulales bacterium]|nr:hypothetical protein [Pirellulales bacterium]
MSTSTARPKPTSAHKSAHSTESSGIEPRAAGDAQKKSPALPGIVASCDYVKTYGSSPTRGRTNADCAGILGDARKSGAESGAVSRSFDRDAVQAAPAGRPVDPELAAITQAWPNLPPAIRAKIVKLAGNVTETTPRGRQ